MPAQYALRPVSLWDLPALKRWRSLPDVQKHLRHPKPPTWLQHFRWFLRTRNDPTCFVRAVLRDGVLIGVAGCYYLFQGTGELSVLCVDKGNESYEYNLEALKLVIAQAPVRNVWAEVYHTAPKVRGALFELVGLVAVPSLPSWIARSPSRPNEPSRLYWHPKGYP